MKWLCKKTPLPKQTGCKRTWGLGGQVGGAVKGPMHCCVYDHETWCTRAGCLFVLGIYMVACRRPRGSETLAAAVVC